MVEGLNELLHTEFTILGMVVPQKCCLRKEITLFVNHPRYDTVDARLTGSCKGEQERSMLSRVLQLISDNSH